MAFQAVKLLRTLDSKKLKPENIVDTLAKENLLGKYISKGSTRSVYELGSKFVLKVALYKSFTSQNATEVKAYVSCPLPEKEKYLAEIVDWDETNFYWLVMEKVGNDKEEKIEKVLDLLDPIEAFPDYEDEGSKETRAEYLLTKLSNMMWRDLILNSPNKDWVRGLRKIVEHCKIYIDDIFLENVGIRQSTGELVIIDYAQRNMLEYTVVLKNIWKQLVEELKQQP